MPGRVSFADQTPLAQEKDSRFPDITGQRVGFSGVLELKEY